MIKSGFLRFCNDPEIACCKAERELEQLRNENATLQAELAESQWQLQAAVEDMTHIATSIANCKEFLSGKTDQVKELKLGRCDVCKGICHEDKPCKFEWRGPQEAGKGEAK